MKIRLLLKPVIEKMVLLKSGISGIACLKPLLSNKMVLLKSGISGIACL